jgi:O-antigen/teichoic acid export membrane protein
MGVFGAKAIGSRLLTDVRQNGDKLVVGRVLGSSSLGIYLLANNIVLLPFSRVVAPMQDVLFPAFSRLQESPEVVASAWLRVNRMLASVTMPAMIGLVVVAPEFVAVVLGDKWHSAVPLIQLLAWTGLVQALQGLYPSIFTAMDRAGRLLVLTTASVVLSFVGLGVGLQWGIRGVAVAYAVVNTGTFVVFTGLIARELRVSFFRVTRSFAGATAATAVMALLTLAARYGMVQAGLPAVLRLVGLIVLGAAVYGGTSFWTSRDVLNDVRSLRARRRGLVSGDVAPEL